MPGAQAQARLVFLRIVKKFEKIGIFLKKTLAKQRDFYYNGSAWAKTHDINATHPVIGCPRARKGGLTEMIGVEEKQKGENQKCLSYL